LFRAVLIDDGHACEPATCFLDGHLPGTANQMVVAVERDVEQVVLRVVRDADQRDPFGRYLVAEIEGGYFDLGGA